MYYMYSCSRLHVVFEYSSRICMDFLDFARTENETPGHPVILIKSNFARHKL